MTRSVVITGGAGFIGSNLVRYLLQETDFEITIVDKLTYAGNMGTLGDIVHDRRVRFIRGDICDANCLRTVFHASRPDGVFHLAAESHVDRSIDGPDEFISTNVMGTFHLLQETRRYLISSPAGRRDRFRFIHVSTDEVYGSLGPDDPPFEETTPYDPRSPYAATKAASDHLVRAWYNTYGVPAIITNSCNNYGPFQYPEKLIPVTIIKALRREPIPVYGRGENVRDWLFVQDHARALWEVFHKGQPGESYNIGGACELRNIDLVRAICRHLDELAPFDDGDPHSRTHRRAGNYEDLITFVEDRPGHDFRYAINATKLRQATQWAPTESTESGLRSTVRWYICNRGWWEQILTGLQMTRRGRLTQGTEIRNLAS